MAMQQRSAWGNASIISTASTSSELSSSSSSSSLSLRGSFFGSPMDASTATCFEEGWMYWKRECECWLKVYVVLRNEFIWLTKGVETRQSKSKASPLIHMAVCNVTKTTIGGFLIEGASGETMELFLYDQEQASDWYSAFCEAVVLAQAYQRTLVEAQAHVSSEQKKREVGPMYTGTLVLYNQDRKPRPWKQLLSSKGIRDGWKRRLERLLDRLDGSRKTKTLMY